MPELAPEARAREQIDALLIAAGWTLQDYTRFDASASRSIALREIPVSGGRCDYLLLIDRSPVGVIEAKKVGTTLSMVAKQSAYYGSNLPEFLQRSTGPLPFYYESTGIETFFRDQRDPEPRSRRLFAFHIETFDFIVTDECHRSIYNLWRQVLEYFDAFLIGLTATPSKQTIGFFEQNLVTEYNHERAVADGRQRWLRRVPHQDAGHRPRRHGREGFLCGQAPQGDPRPPLGAA